MFVSVCKHAHACANECAYMCKMHFNSQCCSLACYKMFAAISWYLGKYFPLHVHQFQCKAQLTFTVS
jgi:hypothetical protein